MSKLLLVLAFLLNASVILYAQGERNVWAFGENAGIDFNSGTAVPIRTGISQLEGSASICDASGQLLMYSDGDTIYNRNHVPMPNGAALAPYNRSNAYRHTTYTTSQASVIVPHPGNRNLYYVFSLEGATIYTFGRLNYSIVDMSLDGGLGDVVPGQKAIQIDTSLHEKMTVVAGCNNNIWLIVHGEVENYYLKNRYKSYEITASGLNLVPVRSDISSIYGTYNEYGIYNDLIYFIGGIKFSHDRTKMAAALYTWFRLEPSVIELYDFDPCSGVISNPLMIAHDTFYNDTVGNRYYNVCFSPDDSKLYAGCNYTGIYQFDLNLPPASIAQSKTLIYSRPWNSERKKYIGDMSCGAGGRIYVATSQHTSLHTIENPNAAGTACGFIENGFPLLPGTGSMYGLPNDVAVPILSVDTIAIVAHDTGICYEMTLSARDSSCRYTWNTGATTQNIVIDTPGVYWVVSQEYCSVYIDTFRVIQYDLDTPILSIRDSIVCSAPLAELKLSVTVLNPNNASYEWQPYASVQSGQGTSDVIVDAIMSQQFIVTVTNSDRCITSATDTMVLHFVDIKNDLGNDITLCNGTAVDIRLKTVIPEAGRALWSTGQTDSVIVAADFGIYWVRLSDSGCNVTDSLHIIEEWCDCRLFIPDAFSPNGDGLNDIFKPIPEDPACFNIGAYWLQVYNRWGQEVYNGTRLQKGWDGTYGGNLLDGGTYMYRIQYSLGTHPKQWKALKGDIILVR